MKNSVRTAILFLLFVALGVYYPVIFADMNTVDDQNMIMGTANAAESDWRSVFMPGGGYYYRPLLVLSFLFDKALWDLDPSFMHLENILVHSLNVILLFLVARKIFATFAPERTYLPLLSALLFCLHPVNTEAVAWISGRTDPLATFFVLLSMIPLIKALEEDKPRYLYLSALCMLVGAMAKEVAVFFFPAACIITLFWPQEASDKGLLLPRKMRQILHLSLPFAMGGFVYLLFRTLAVGTDSGIQRIFSGNTSDLFDSFRIVLKVFGFYVKKLFVPVPLNFAIVSVSEWYVLLGGVALLVLLCMVRWRQVISGVWVAAFFLITPAIIVALFRVAWTPLAERYLYLPSAFFSIAVVGSVYLCCRTIGKERLVIPLVSLLLCPALLVTVQRNLVWQDNLTLFQDTLEKSPNFLPARNELAAALINHGRIEEGKALLRQNSREAEAGEYLPADINLAAVYAYEGKYQEARKLLQGLMHPSAKNYTQVLMALVRIDHQYHDKVTDKGLRREIYKEILYCLQELRRLTQDPVYDYQIGKAHLALGETAMARKHFEMAFRHAPEGASYASAAKVLAQRLATK